MKSDTFNAHLDKCSQCANQPFNLCPTGAELLMETGGFRMPGKLPERTAWVGRNKKCGCVVYACYNGEVDGYARRDYNMEQVPVEEARKLLEACGHTCGRVFIGEVEVTDKRLTPKPRPPLRQTHTYVTLAISPAAYQEIKQKLTDASYQHCFNGDDIDMSGIALCPEE